jgi:hypothetical protein
MPAARLDVIIHATAVICTVFASDVVRPLWGWGSWMGELRRRRRFDGNDSRVLLIN